MQLASYCIGTLTFVYAIIICVSSGTQCSTSQCPKTCQLCALNAFFLQPLETLVVRYIVDKRTVKAPPPRRVAHAITAHHFTRVQRCEVGCTNVKSRTLCVGSGVRGADASHSVLFSFRPMFSTGVASVENFWGSCILGQCPCHWCRTSVSLTLEPALTRAPRT